MTDPTTAPVVLNLHAVRNAVAAAGMRYTSNTVRPPRSAKVIASTSGLILEGDLAGAYLLVTLYSGQASGRARWWTVLSITDEPGNVAWAIGTRWSVEAKARADYVKSAAAMRMVDR